MSSQANQTFSEGRQLRFRGNMARFSSAKVVLLGISGLSFGLALYNKQVLAKRAQADIDWKKDRLRQPITDLTDENGTTYPWSSKNVDEYLYKPFRITGRPLHNKAVLIPSKSFGLTGFQYIVPVCTKETEGGDAIEGVFVNKGFIPHERQHVANRFRIEDAFHQQTFTCYLSKLDKYSEHSAFGKGNSPNVLVRNKWNYADLKDMAKIADLQNNSVVSTAALESVNLDSDLDERNAHTLDINSDYREDYPYRQTMSGALQSPQMPWDYRNKGNNYQTLGFVSGALALLFAF